MWIKIRYNRGCLVIAFWILVLLYPGWAWAQSLAPILSRPLDLAPPLAPGGGDQPSFVVDGFVTYGLVWGYVFTVNRGLGRDIRQSNLNNLWKNWKTPPEWPDDGDDLVTNFIAHPLFGASLYQFYRFRGHPPMQSFTGTLLQSTLFEYTIEGFKQPASGMDLITTPVLGSLLGHSLGGYQVFLLSSSYSVAKYILRWF